MNSGYVAVMDWQQMISLTIVVGAAVLLLRSKLRRPKFGFQRATHCGCAGAGSSAAQGSIIFRARKGEPRQVIVKM